MELIVGLIIITSNYSSRVGRVFGSNPVAVLATLFLLSYAKFLRTIIATFFSPSWTIPTMNKLLCGCMMAIFDTFTVSTSFSFLLPC